MTTYAEREPKMTRVAVIVACLVGPVMGFCTGVWAMQGHAMLAAWGGLTTGFLCAGAPLLWLNSKILAHNRELTQQSVQLLAERRAALDHTHVRGVQRDARYP